MNDENEKMLEEKIRALNALFAVKLPAKIGEINTVWLHCEQTPSDPGHWKNLHRLLHMLAGSSGSFGFEELGARAKEIEHAINALLDSGGNDSGQARLEFSAQLSQFTQWAMDSTSCT